MKAIDDYVENETDVQALWTYKADEGGIVEECEVSTWFNMTAEVTLTIFISTSVIIAHGQICQKFVETEFGKTRSKLLLDS